MPLPRFDPDDPDTAWPGEDLQISPDAVNLDVLNDTFSFFIRDLNIAVSRDWEARIHDLPAVRGTGKVTILVMIGNHPGVRPSAIAQIILRDRAEVARQVDGLVRAGLVERRPGRRDSRSQALFLTDAGCLVLEELRGRIRDSRAFLSDVTDEEYAQVMTLLRRIYWRLVMTPRPAGGQS